MFEYYFHAILVAKYKMLGFNKTKKSLLFLPTIVSIYFGFKNMFVSNYFVNALDFMPSTYELDLKLNSSFSIDKLSLYKMGMIIIKYITYAN